MWYNECRTDVREQGTDGLVCGRSVMAAYMPGPLPTTPTVWGRPRAPGTVVQEPGEEGRAIARLVRAHDKVLSGRPIRLVADEEAEGGVFQFEEALARAEAAGLDLVEVAPQASPPVCRIMNYGKFLYAQNKKQRDAKKKQLQHKFKEVKYHPNIDEHDYKTKLAHIVAFLEKGCKVKVSMFFRGREMAHTELGIQIMNRVAADVAAVGTIESPPRQQGRSIIMMLGAASR